VLRTRSPLIPGPKPGSPFDLHVLSAPPAFVLSQDQTLRRDPGLLAHPKASGSTVFYTGVRSAARGTSPPILSDHPLVADGVELQSDRDMANHGPL
jgi:hypothetical protein